MFVKSSPENETFLWATLVFALSSYRQWAVPASLQGPTLRARDALLPSCRAAKLPTQEFTKLLLLMVLPLWSHYSNEHHCKQRHFRWQVTLPIHRWLMIPLRTPAEAGQPCSISLFPDLPLYISAHPIAEYGLVQLSQVLILYSINLIHIHLVTAISVVKMVLECCRTQYTLRKLNLWHKRLMDGGKGWRSGKKQMKRFLFRVMTGNK